MMISFAPKKNAVLRGSRPLGISSKNSVLSAQSKCYAPWSATRHPQHRDRDRLTRWI